MGASKECNKGAATKIDEYVPTMTPMRIGKLYTAITGPPKKYKAHKETIVDSDVSIVRDKVLLIALLISVVVSASVCVESLRRS